MTTITHEQFEAVWEKFRNMDEVPMAAFGIVLADLGITIAPPQPSPEMVTLAEAAYWKHGHPSKYNTEWEAGYIAALQHVERVVKDLQPDWQDSANATGALLAILTAIGSK